MYDDDSYELDILSSLVIYFSALLLIFQAEGGPVDAIAGLALSNALQMLVFVQWTVRMTSELLSVHETTLR